MRKRAPKILDVEKRAAFLVESGCKREREGDFVKAAACYRQALSLKPADERIWYFSNNNLGYSLNQLEQYADSERFCREAIKSDPRRYNAHKNLGIALQGQGRLPEALASLVRAVELCPLDPRAGRHIFALVSTHPELLEQRPDIGARLVKMPWFTGCASA